CLTVSNANGSDTKCRELQLGMVSGAGQVQGSRFEVQVFPNPFRERFTVSLPEGWLPQAARLWLYDGLGRRVLSQRLRAGANEVAAGGLPPGVYFYVVEENGVVLAQGKVVKG
ncbi:MAG: T9SS type A sorting domain-containing protein, partial [Phaeodactylibacter sp.]|nr:T9SS type A sorting domain-containing protein [Phaeodactylibacter sp.]